MHLLLGDPQDPCCLSVRAALEARGLPARIIVNPLASGARFALRVSSEQCASQLLWDGEPPVVEGGIAGVLVSSIQCIDPDGWQPKDLIYMYAETQAMLLAWLWSLACPVVNRYPSAIWYQPQIPLLFWQRLLRRCGLPAMETVVTNVEREARSFRQRLAIEGVAGAVYGPLTSDVRYLVTSDEDWSRIATMQRHTPVCLTYPHEAAQLVYVVGRRVIWEGMPSPKVASFEPALRRFSTAAGLDFVELAFAQTCKGIRVIAVEPRPRVERFGDTTRHQVVEELVNLLTAEVDYSRQGVQHSS